MEELYKYFPNNITAFLKMYENKSVTEIRLRRNSPLILMMCGKLCCFENMYVSEQQLNDIFFEMCDKSINAYEDSISEGYITLAGGYRVGISGDFYFNKNLKRYLLRKLVSINVRIPKENLFFKNQNFLLSLNPESILIAGPPHSGKTSLIKIYAKLLSKKYSVCICDERRELYDDKISCDVLCGVKKAEAISMATRTLNPQFIICDEIGTKTEAEEILSAVNTGVEFICSAHGKTVEEILKRPNIKILIDSGVFKRIAVLSSIDNLFEIKEIINV